MFGINVKSIDHKQHDQTRLFKIYISIKIIRLCFSNRCTLDSFNITLCIYINLFLNVDFFFLIYYGLHNLKRK